MEQESRFRGHESSKVGRVQLPIPDSSLAHPTRWCGAPLLEDVFGPLKLLRLQALPADIANDKGRYHTR